MRIYGDDAELMNLPRLRRVEDYYIQSVWYERAILDEYRKLVGEYTVLEQKYNDLIKEPNLP